VSLKDKVLFGVEEVIPPAPVFEPVQFESLEAILDGEIEDPEILIDELVYAEGVHELSGHPGCGKTTLAAWFAHHEVSQGRPCVWFDMESGTRQAARRFQAIGITGSMARDLHYAPFPTNIAEHMGSVAERWPGALVVIDSMSKALADQGISENANDEVTGWTVQIVKAAKQLHLPIVIIDHITKGGQQSDYSRGAGAKQADVDVHWRIEKVEEFNRVQAGLIHLRATKDREGYLGFNHWYRVGDGKGKLPLVRTTGPDHDREDDGSKPPI
jgi:predicted ATP-dependent serine protease